MYVLSLSCSQSSMKSTIKWYNSMIFVSFTLSSLRFVFPIVIQIRNWTATFLFSWIKALYYLLPHYCLKIPKRWVFFSFLAMLSLSTKSHWQFVPTILRYPSNSKLAHTEIFVSPKRGDCFQWSTSRNCRDWSGSSRQLYGWSGCWGQSSNLVQVLYTWVAWGLPGILIKNDFTLLLDSTRPRATWRWIRS
jgi:hypothetical protein